MKKIKIWFMILAAVTTVGLTGCFNLDEKVYSKITEDTFNASEEDLVALMGSAYCPLQYIMSWQGLFDAQEEPGDVIITPVRPDGWDDGGTYQRMHKHTWTNLEYQHTNTYATCFAAICKANKVMDQINAGKYKMDETSKNATVDELRAVRALWYSILLDTHGNVPLVKHFTDTIPVYSTRQQIYDFVVSELTTVLKNERLSKSSGALEYGRLNHWGAMMTLMRVYLNAGVYTGTPQWAKALACAEDVINSKVYTLSGNYSDNFKVDLDATNTEVIFAVPYSGTHYLTYTFCMNAKWYPPVSRAHFGWRYQCWDGSCANPQFIDSYDANDPRLGKTWLMGPQMAKDDPKQLVWTCLNYLPSLTSKDDEGNSMTSSDYGYRVNKFEQDTKTSFYWNNDFPYYRLAEAYLAKAECLLRLGIREDEALEAVNTVRQRNVDPAPAVTLADLKGNTKIKYGLVGWGSLTKAQYDDVVSNKISWSDLAGLEHSQTVTQSGDDATPVFLGGLYDEWGWEFACEAQRRTEMIRFGTYSTRNWFNHTAITDGHTAIFPIPEDELNANSNLRQNPGY
ncbi:MAG TPA: RagB/SusD family nutrient uptake outer membrane protein [Bacteroidales bacterium]|nr:RagB/SusD family nutrient uptake outer membrane protein [Bacteroidales bacterium]HPT11342.1 RagB/SusD family nutrient uptake outer membrane protein [Bacteroidales bacterium]